jgi:hypothetical protein
MVNSMQTARSKAAEALKAVLHQVSQVKLKDISLPDPDLKTDIVASVDVHGHRRTLVCRVKASGRPEHVLVALDELQSLAGQFDGDAMPVIIAPHLSEEAQALCGARKAGFLDLAGNARLDLGEVFICRRTLPQSAENSPASLSSREDVQLAGVA